MAGKIGKGFTSYLLVLFIALVAAFLICVTVMLFSPFKSVLGFKYFVYQDEAFEYNVSGGADDEFFDFSTQTTQVNINCDFAKVTVQRYVMVDRCAVKFTNKSKGFARDNQNTDFTYDIYYTDATKSTLNIEVHEPEGFLYFSKEIIISVLVPSSQMFSLENTKIDITNTSGDIFIGNDIELSTGKSEIDLNSLSIKTNSGKIMLYPYIDNNFNDIFIKTNKSEVIFTKDIVVNKKFEIHSTSGDLEFKAIDYNNTSASAVIDIANSKFNCTQIDGNVDLAIKSGYFDATTINGNIVSNDSNKQMSSATITINEMTGVASFPFANKSKVNIGTMKNGSELFVRATSGNVKVAKTYGNAYIETTSGDVNIHTFANDIKVKTESGDIKVVYDNSTIANQLDFSTVKGKIDLQIKSNLAFILAVYNNDGQLRDSGVYIDFINGKFTNPLPVNGGTKNIKITSNSDINVSLLDVA